MDIKLFDKRYVYLEWSDELEGKDCILAKTYQDLKDFVNSGDDGRIMKVNKGNEKPFTNGCSECDFCYYDSNYIVKRAWMNGEKIQMKVDDEWEDLEFKYRKDENYKIEWDENEWRVKPIIPNSIRNLYMYYDYENENHRFLISSEDFGNIHGIYHKVFSGTLNQCADRKDFYEKMISLHKLHCSKCKYYDAFGYVNDGLCAKCSYYSNFEEDGNKNTDKPKYRRMVNRELSEWLAKGNGEIMKSYYSMMDTKFMTVVYPWHQYLVENSDDEVEEGIMIREFGSDEWKEPLIEV